MIGMRCIVLIYFGVLLSMAMCPSGLAGELEKFRKATSKKSSTSMPAKKSSSSSSSFDDDDSPLEELGSKIFWYSMLGLAGATVEGGVASHRRYTGSDERSWGRVDPQPARTRGETTIPLLRLDGNVHRVSENLDALDGRIEVGYGAFAVEYRHTRFTESLSEDREDQLDLSQVMGLYRMTTLPQLELDIGFGAGSFDNEDQGYNFEFLLGTHYRHNDHLAGEWRGAWINAAGHSVSDQDLALMAGVKHLALRVGYRWISSGEEADLGGPNVGLVLTW